MRLGFLGKAAAEGFPTPCSADATCEGARREGGPSRRERVSTLADADVNPDMRSSVQQRRHRTTAIPPYAHSHHLEPGTFCHHPRPCRTVGTTPHDAASVQDAAPGMGLAIRELLAGRRPCKSRDAGCRPDGAWQRLADPGWRRDVRSHDVPFGFGDRPSRHMHRGQVHTEGMATAGLIGSGGTREFAHSRAHHRHPCRSELVHQCGACDLEIAHDNLKGEWPR